MKYKLSLTIEAPKYTAPGDWPESAWAEEILEQILGDSIHKARVKLLELNIESNKGRTRNGTTMLIEDQKKWWENRIKELEKIESTIKWEK